MNCDLEDVKSIQKCAEIGGEAIMLKQIQESFTNIVIDYAVCDEKLIKRIADAADADRIFRLVVEWYYSQVPVVPNEMFNDLMCKASGFVFFDEVTKVLTDLILER